MIREHQEKRSKKHGKYYIAQKEHIALENKKYRETHKDEERERNREWRKNNQEYYNLYQREYRASHKDHIEARRKKRAELKSALQKMK